VVSRNLQCLVNKLSETTAITLSSDLAPREISSNSLAAGWQLFKIGDRLPTVTFSLPFCASGVRFSAHSYRSQQNHREYRQERGRFGSTADSEGSLLAKADIPPKAHGD
jgi:hypothetical protein